MEKKKKNRIQILTLNFINIHHTLVCDMREKSIRQQKSKKKEQQKAKRSRSLEHSIEERF